MSLLSELKCGLLRGGNGATLKTWLCSLRRFWTEDANAYLSENPVKVLGLRKLQTVALDFFVAVTIKEISFKLLFSEILWHGH